MADEIAVFATPDVGRVFLLCRRCRHVVPHYRCYGSADEPGIGRCRWCGSNEFCPGRIANWWAAVWVLGVGWLWRKTLRGFQMWDPRMPIRQ